MKEPSRTRSLSLFLSYLFSLLFALLLVALCFLLPRLVPSLLSAPDLIGDRTSLPRGVEILILVLSYLIVAVTLLAVGFLLSLLRCVRRGEVFSLAAVKGILRISVCCFAEGVLFLVIGIWFQLSLLVFAMACFLALCLRIVGGVLLEAIRYKAENDLTV